MFKFCFNSWRAISICTAILVCCLSILLSKAWAQEMPGAPEASPDIYKVLAENELMRVLLATWKPGDRDQWHSHPPSSVYYVTDCQVRAFFPDGSQKDLMRIKDTGRARNRPVKSHSVQNIGTSECKIQLTEVKPQ
jgi:hypothetical protein